MKTVIQKTRLKHSAKLKPPARKLDKTTNNTTAKISSNTATPIVNCANGCFIAFLFLMIGMATILELIEKIAPRKVPSMGSHPKIFAAMEPIKNATIHWKNMAKMDGKSVCCSFFKSNSRPIQNIKKITPNSLIL